MKSGFGRILERLVVTPIIAVILIATCFMPSAYVSAYLRATYYPPSRLFVIPQFVFYCAVCLEGYWLGVGLRQRAVSLATRSVKYMSWLFGVAAPFSSVRSIWALGAKCSGMAGRGLEVSPLVGKKKKKKPAPLEAGG